jgi:hypothetical protein
MICSWNIAGKAQSIDAAEARHQIKIKQKQTSLVSARFIGFRLGSDPDVVALGTKGNNGLPQISFLLDSNC